MNQEVEEMAEELETVLENEPEVIEEPTEEIEYSEVELQAMEKGWSPEGVEGKRNLTAEEFLDRQPLFDKMHKLEKRLKEQSKAVEAIKQHGEMAREQMHKDHLKELEAAKRAAYEEMDFEKADKISDEIVEAKVEHAKAEPAASVDPQQEIQETLEEWVEKNNWYKEDEFLQRQAEKEGKLFRMENPDASFDDVLDHISKTVKKDFPEKFQNMNRTKPSSVEGAAQGGRRAPTASKQKTIKDLPEEAVPVMKTLIRAGAFKSEQDYVNDYFNQ